MSWLRARLTKGRLVAVAVLMTIAVVVIIAGDPLAHPEEGANPDGSKGLAGVPRIVELTAVAIAIILAMPPKDRVEEQDEDGEG